MQCPFCSSPETRVADKRNIDGSDIIRRRRECRACKKRFTTYERIELPELFVVKKDHTREPFIREKLMLGIQKATEKRPISDTHVHTLAQEIEQTLRKKGDRTILSKTIGDMVMRKLKRLDKVAYVRFASVYRSFDSLTEFQEEVRRLLHTRGRTKRPFA